MSTTRKRHLVTESDVLAQALDAAAVRWSGLSRPQLLVRLALEGCRNGQVIDDDRRRRRLSAVEAHRGIMTGAYGPGYLARLRDDWPE